jgi:hypothetical protein
LGRPKGSKNLNEARKALNVYIPKSYYEKISNKNKSKYIRQLMEEDFRKKEGNLWKKI